MIQFSVSPSSGLINKASGRGMKRKTVPQTEVNPPAKVGTPQGCSVGEDLVHHQDTSKLSSQIVSLARRKIEALPEITLTSLGFSQSRETEETVDCSLWGIGIIKLILIKLGLVIDF